MVTRERYMRDPLPARLGHLASDLIHIRSSCEMSYANAVVQLVRESMWFIEWAAPDAEPEIGSELVDIQIELATWYWGWDAIWNDPERRAAVADQAGEWSDRILDLSGLLTEN